MPGTVATNIRLPEEVLRTLKYKALEEKKSVNQLIREAIEISLVTEVKTERPGKDSFDKVIGITRSGVKDASAKHDRYLYGKRK